MEFILLCSCSFTIEDFHGERLYLVNLNVSFCLEAGEDCIRTVTVYRDTLLPKRVCPWDQNQGPWNLILFSTVTPYLLVNFSYLFRLWECSDYENVLCRLYKKWSNKYILNYNSMVFVIYFVENWQHTYQNQGWSR